MLVDDIQKHLESIYGVRCELRASDVLVDAETARALGGSGTEKEEVLVQESADGLGLALFLPPVLLEKLNAAGTDLRALAEKHLGSFCEVAEGVSHVLYLGHTAGHDRQVSMLELEAQAEVDKFAICSLLELSRASSADTPRLMRRLFEQVRYRASLEPDETRRYEEANRLAAAYCRRLTPLITARRIDKLLSELRYTYRMGAEAKLRRFAEGNVESG